MKPGVTGWAQINCTYGDTMEDVATKLNTTCITSEPGAVADAYILFHTAKIVLSGAWLN